MPTGLQLAVAALRAPMEGAGFLPRAGGRYVIPLAPGMMGIVGLVHATRGYGPGETSLYPIVGVRAEVVEWIVAALQGSKLQQYYPYTISRPLGEIAGLRYIDANWAFGPGNTDVPASDLVATLVRHGLPFMREHSTLPAIWKAIEQRWCRTPEYRKPVVLALLGQRAEAHAVLDQLEAGMAGRQDPAAQEWRRFAVAFRQRNWATS